MGCQLKSFSLKSMNSEKFGTVHTEEELAYYERKLSAEILKCKAAIDRKKRSLEVLQSKVLLTPMPNGKPF